MSKKSSIILALALGHSSVFAGTMMAAGHVENISFKLNQASDACSIPKPLVIEVQRPTSMSKHLNLPKDSPYASISAGACNKMNKMAPNAVRRFQDTVISNDDKRTIVLNGIYDPAQQTITGNWSDNFGCKGPLFGTAS